MKASFDRLQRESEEEAGLIDWGELTSLLDRRFSGRETDMKL